MLSRFKKLSTQIIGMLLIFFVVALGAIGMTLALSWQLEGGSAAINDAGSERMRSYRFSHLMALGLEPGADRVRVDAALAEEITLFEKLLADIGRGDPARPLAPPRTAEVKRRIGHLHQVWESRMRPVLRRLF
jgi:two-component system nitrate/nitrite sensor histidine kinase NarX